MKKDFLFLKRSRWLLFALLTMIVGASPTWADTLTEDFESLTVDGTTLSNGWFVQGGTLKSTVTSITSSSSWGNNAGNSNYELITQGANSTSNSICNYESSNTNKYLIIPIELTGKIKFYAGGCRTSGTRKVEVYRVSYDSETDVYTIGQKIGSTVYPSARLSSSATPNWLANKQEVDLDSEHTMVAFLLQGSAIDEVEAEKYVYTPYVEPASLSATTSGESADITWTAGETEETITAWNLEYKKTADDTWTEVHNISASSFTYTISDLNSNTSYDVRVKAVYGENESSWKTTTFKTAKVAVPATGFTDNFETDKGWDFVTVGTSSNSWVRGTATNNGGTAAMYISNDGGTSNAYATSGAMAAYAAKLFSFEAGDYTISYDWKANGETTYDYLRVALVPASDELTAAYSSIGTSSLPTGWTELDGGSKLNLKTEWQSVSKDITIAEAGSYQIVFAWRNDGSGGSNSPAAIDNLKIIGAAPVLELGGDVVGTTLDFGSVAETTNKTVRITNSGKVAMENITLTETADEDNVFAYADLPKTTLAANESMDVQVTFSGSSAKDYTGTFRVAADDCDPIDVTVTATYSNSPATMAIALGEEAVGASVAFGSVGKQATKTFTITNDGDQTLNITSIVSNNTTDFTVTPATLTVTGHSSETFTVTFVYPNENPVLDTEKTANITVNASNDGIDPVQFAVTGTRIEQWSEDFSGNALPEGWETTSTTYWTFADGVAKGTYQSTNYYLTTPSLTVEEGASLSFDVCANTTYVTMTIEQQLNNGSWATCKDISYSSDFGSIGTGVWKTFTIDGLEAGNYKFRFNARGFWLDNFQGFKRNMNDPKMGVYSDAECTAAVATSVAKDFGFATETQTANYYIKNDGTGTMTLALGAAPDGITQSLDKTSVAAGEHATLTITMPAENKGYHGGNVVVTATDLGTFTVAVTGVIVDEDKLNLNFTSDKVPSTWTRGNWSETATIGYYSSPQTMFTSNLTAVAGEDFVVVAKMDYTSSSYSFGVKYKKTDAEEWSDLIPAANIGTSYVMLHGTIAEAGTYQLQFNGQYTQIQRIYGLSIPEEPVMVVYDGESLAATTYDFGNVSDEADATWTLTVKNEGKAELTGLAAALTGDNADHYSVEVSAETIAVDETATITVKQLKDNLGAHAATLTISATGLDNQVIALSGNTYDHTKLFVDFEDGNLPDGWTKGSYWSVSQVSGNTNHSLGHSYGSSYASSVVTTPLTVAEDETLTFGASRYYSSYAPTLKVRYTADGGLTWSEYTDFSSEITSSYSGNTFKELTLTGVPAGTVVLEFYGAYVRLDNIYGFTATTAPLLALTESSTVVENNSTKEFGTLTAEATATYTLTNNGTADMVSTVATTGVATAAITTTEAEGVTISENTVTLAAGKSATITLTLPYADPYGEKEGAMTITTEGWVADFTVNYTATTVDPTALYINFADNAKPEGWYQEGWSFTSGYASAAYVANKQMITQKLTCAGTDDVLSFDVWPYTSSYGDYANALTVEYSADRQNWTAFANQPAFDNTDRQNGVQVSGAPAGDYYVRFTGSYVYMDNIAGWHKVTGIEHDLYVSATSFPTATLIPETSNGVAATATVYSLRADETGVYAKLFFDETEMATSTTKDISKDGSQSFTMTCNVPAEEKTYAAKIVVYYSDGTEAWETPTTDVVVSHTRTLQITDFALTSDATAEADSDNQFTSTFNVTVKNTGSIAYTPAQVSVNVTDAEGNAYGEATTWTAANSQTIYLNPGEYAGSDAVLALYSWSNGDYWAAFNQIGETGVYSADLNGATEFIIVRLKPSTEADYSSDNNGFNWDNKWNQSANLSTTNGNTFTFSSWVDGGNDVFNASTKAELAKGESTTLQVTVTTSALEGGEFTFKAKENMSNTVSTASATVTVTAAAPKFALYQDATPVNDGDDVQFGIVKGTKDFTFTITNEGNKMMEKPEMAVPEGFEANYVAADGADADWMLFFWKKDTELNADQGNFKATATDGKFIIENVNVPYEGVNFAVHKKEGDNWYDTYGYSDEGGHLDATAKATKLAEATNASGWMTIAAGNYDFIWNATDLTLTAKPAGAILAGDSQDVNVTLKAEQGKVSGDLVFTYAVDANTDKTFTLALSGRSIAADTWTVDFEDGTIPSNWDNSNGWTVYETDGNNVARLTGWDAKAIITPRLAAQKDDILTFDVLSLGNEISYAYSTDRKSWSDEVTVSAIGEQTFTAPADGNYYLRITARNAYVDNFVGFRLNPNTLQLNETETPDLAEEFYETITLNRTFAAGWNTVCLPFEISNVTGFFGANAKAYDFTDYTSEGALNFQVTSALEAGKPYIVYVESAINDAIILSNTTVSSATASNTVQNEATFQGTYAPMAAGTMTGNYGVTKDAKIAKGTSTASMKGFRAYFQLPDGVSARIAFFDEDGTVTYIGGVSVDELTNGTVYNMQGQRITSPNKSGLYIINGKKTVVKKH